MPANVEIFDKVTVLASEVYVEPSFLLDLIRYPNDPRNPRLSSSKTFYDKLLANQSRMWTSTLGLQEIVWKILRGKIFSEMRKLGFEGLTLADFKQNRPAEYAQALQKFRPDVKRTFDTFFAFGIQLRVPVPFKIPLHQKGRRIAQYARAILMRYNLEPADAFHIAIARCEKTNFIVTNDRRFQDVDTISVYSYSN